MKLLIAVFRKLGLSRPGRGAAQEKPSEFDRRMKMVNRARVVNAAGLGGPVFKSRETR